MTRRCWIALLALAFLPLDGSAQSPRIDAILALVRADSRLEVFYLASPDCPYCVHWESRSRAEFLAWAADKNLGYAEIRNETLRQPITDRHYPAEHRWVYEQIGPSRGVPRFLLAVDGRIVLSTYGTNRFSEIFFPALKEVAARRANSS